MITTHDITRLSDAFVTKKEFQFFREEMGDFRVNTAERLENLEDRMGSVEGKIDTLLVMTDALLGTYKDSMDEHRVGAHILGRHARQLEALSVGTGIVLPD